MPTRNYRSKKRSYKQKSLRGGELKLNLMRSDKQKGGAIRSMSKLYSSQFKSMTGGFKLRRKSIRNNRFLRNKRKRTRRRLKGGGKGCGCSRYGKSL